MYEVEMKFRTSSPERLVQELEHRFFTSFGPEQLERDLYFQHPCRNFVETDEAFRLRQVNGELKITYKGPKLDKATKTREEIELPLLALETENTRSPERDKRFGDWQRLLERLGFVPAAVVEKKRRVCRFTYQNLPFEATLDYLEPLGWFTELETIAAGPFETARNTLLNLAAELGLNESVQDSYLNLLQKLQKSRTTLSEKHSKSEKA